MTHDNFQIATNTVENYLLLRLFGTRNAAQRAAFGTQFLRFYRAQPMRSILVDLRAAIYPETDYSLVQFISELASEAPRSRVALWVNNEEDPATFLLAEAIRASGHDVIVTNSRQKAAGFMAPRRRPAERRRLCLPVR